MSFNINKAGFTRKPVAMLLLGLATVCGPAAYAQQNMHNGNDAPSASPKTPFIDRANMDLSVKPGDNFYQYASGNWIKKNPVPAKETRWGSFNVLRDFNINAVRSILQESAANTNAASGSLEKRVGDFYAAGMDSARIDKLGYKPIKDDLKKAGKVKTHQDVLEYAAKMRTSGVGSPMFGFYIAQDRKNPNVMVPNLSQGGTTLPDRD